MEYQEHKSEGYLDPPTWIDELPAFTNSRVLEVASKHDLGTWIKMLQTELGF